MWDWIWIWKVRHVSDWGCRRAHEPLTTGQSVSFISGHRPMRAQRLLPIIVHTHTQTHTQVSSLENNWIKEHNASKARSHTPIHLYMNNTLTPTHTTKHTLCCLILMKSCVCVCVTPRTCFRSDRCNSETTVLAGADGLKLRLQWSHYMCLSETVSAVSLHAVRQF